MEFAFEIDQPRIRLTDDVKLVTLFGCLVVDNVGEKIVKAVFEGTFFIHKGYELKYDALKHDGNERGDQLLFYECLVIFAVRKKKAICVVAHQKRVIESNGVVANPIIGFLFPVILLDDELFYDLHFKEFLKRIVDGSIWKCGVEDLENIGIRNRFVLEDIQDERRFFYLIYFSVDLVLKLRR